MKFLCIFAALLVVAAADFYSYPYYRPDGRIWRPDQERYPADNHRTRGPLVLPRLRRDVSLDHKVGQNGRVFGTLGSNDNGLFGKGGYEHNIFNDHRGKLDGQVHGTRVLGPYGDSSHLGGALNWQNSNAAASLDVSRQIHGPTSINAGAGGRWPVGRNGDVSAQGFYGQTSGRGRDYGGRAVFNYRW